MSINNVTASVIIPTHNRCVSLQRLLLALSLQTYPLDELEVIVVADGCVDETMNMLQAFTPNYRLRIFEQTGQGPAAARNYGASHAVGNILIFLDDDMEPCPVLVKAHIEIHQKHRSVAGVGYYPPVLSSQHGFFKIQLRAWWQKFFQVMRQPEHRFNYQDLLTGNVSLATETFAKTGGFDQKLNVHEDYEFGIRLLKAGMTFVFIEDAFAWHHEGSDLNHVFERKYHEGQADILIGRRHPDVIKALPLASMMARQSLPWRVVKLFAFQFPRLGDTLAWAFRSLLIPLEWMRMRGRWQWLLDILLSYWYYRGIAIELQDWKSVLRFMKKDLLSTDIRDCEIEIDLTHGLDEAELRLDREKPASAIIRYDHYLIGHIPPQPATESLKGHHLRPILATQFAKQILRILGLKTAKAAMKDSPNPSSLVP